MQDGSPPARGPDGARRGGLDELPPEARFAVRGVAAGLSFDDVDALLRVEEGHARNPLRAAVRRFVGPPPARAVGDDGLRGALAPVMEMARTPPGRKPATRCPSADIARELARGGLDGPLLLAQAEHAADCPACMARLVAARTGAVPEGGLVADAEVPPPLKPADSGPQTYLAVLGAVFLILILLFLL